MPGVKSLEMQMRGGSARHANVPSRAKSYIVGVREVEQCESQVLEVQRPPNEILNRSGYEKGFESHREWCAAFAGV